MPKRGENIYKRKDGRWEGRYYITNNGQKRLKSVYAHSYSDIKAKLMYVKLNSQKYIENKSGDMDFYSKTWLESVRMSCKPATFTKYRLMYKNHIQQPMGNMKIETVCTEDVRKLINEKHNLSPRTKADILCVIRRIFDYANAEGVTTKVNFKLISIRQEKNEMQIISSAEQQLLFTYLTKNLCFINAGILLSMCTGIRIGELCALQRSDILPDKGILIISRTMQRLQIPSESSATVVITGEPKSKSSSREIPIPECILNITEKLYENLDDNAYLLTGKTDKFIEPRALRYIWKRILEHTNIPYKNFHSIRHTFATRCVEAGFEIKTLSEILGHSSVNITLNRYVHSSMEMKRKNMEKLNEIYTF